MTVKRYLSALVAAAVVATGLVAVTVASAPQAAHADPTYAPGDTIAPIAAYDFDDDQGATVIDSSSSGNNAKWSGTPAYGVGVSGRAAHVSALKNIIALPVIANETDASGSFSYELWLNENSSSSDSAIVSNQAFAHCYNPGFTLYNTGTSGVLQSCYGQNGSSTAQQYEKGVSPATVIGGWHQVTVVVDRTAGTVTDYLDGVQTVQNTALTSAFNLNSGHPFTIGAPGDLESGDGSIDALVDDVNFYDAAIPASQVAADFAATNPATHFPVTVQSDGHGTGTATPLAPAQGAAVTASATAATGYHFASWQAVTPADLTIGADGTFTDPGSPVTVQADFAPNQYTVAFDGNGADGGATDAVTLSYDQPQALPANGFTRTGEQFIGWSATADGDVVYADQASVSDLSTDNGGAVTLYAQWAPAGSFSVTAAGDAHVTAVASEAWALPGDTVTLTPTLDAGYHVGSWQTTPDGLQIGADDTFTMPAANVAVQAVSAANAYTVAFDGNDADGGSAPATQAFTYDQAQPLPADTFTRTGYLFAGWATSATGTVAYTDGQSVSNLSPTDGATVTLYAQWTKPRASGDTVAPLVSYDFDGDTGGTVSDFTPDGLNGSWTGTPAYSSGVSGKAAHVSAGTNFVQLPLVKGETDASGSFSFSTWFGENAEVADTPLVSNGNYSACANGGLTLFNHQGTFETGYCWGNGGSTKYKYDPSSTISLQGSWHYLSMVVDTAAATVTEYVDGAAVSSEPIASGSKFTTGFPITIGEDGPGSYVNVAGYNGTVDALVDDFDFYDQAISATQIAADYNATKPANTTLPTQPVSGVNDLPEGYLASDFATAPVRVGSAVSQPLAGLWNGGTPTGFTKVSGDDWLTVDANGVVTGTAPADAPQHPGLITVQATDGTITDQLTLSVPVIAADDAPQIETATWNLWDAGANVDDALGKDLQAIMQNDLTIIGVQQDGGTVAQQLATDLGWYFYEGADGLGIVSAYPISSDGVVPATSAVPAAGVTVDVAGQPVRVWVAGLDSAGYGPYQPCFNGVTDPTSIVTAEEATTRYAQAQAVAAEVQTDTAASSTTPVILLGDLESPSGADWTDATSASHCNAGPVAWPVPAAFAAAGLTDSFRQANPDPAADAGNTWSPVTPTNANGQPEPQDRIDYVYYAGSALSVVESNTIVSGWPSSADIPDNAWTSDHAAVVTIFTLGTPSQGPTPVVPTATVAKASVTYEVGNGPADDAALLKAVDAGSDQPDATLSVDLGDTDFSTVGDYTVLVTATLAGQTSDPVAVTVHVVPVAKLALAQTSASFGTGADVSSQAVVTALGASLTPSGGTITADLSGVEVDTAGSYPVTIIGTDAYGVTTTLPATVVIDASTYAVTVSPAEHGTASAQPGTAPADGLVTLSETPDAGYHFAGWQAISPADLAIGADGTFTMPGSAVTVSADFEANSYTVVYDGSGSTSGSTAPSAFQYDEAGDVLTANGFVRTGYDFAGWATSVGGDVVYQDGATVQNLTTDAGTAVTLYAVWTPASYPIAYTLGGGVVAVPNPASYTIESGAFTLTNPNRSGYTFAGWSGTGITGTAATVTVAAGSTGARSYTAHWTAANTPPVTTPPLVATTAPAIAGAVRVGQTVTVTPAVWAGATAKSVAYQWLRDGKAVAGATGTSYAIAVGDAGHKLSVVESATAAGFTSGTAASKAVVVGAGILSTAKPTISGIVAVGKQVTAVTGSWKPAPAFAFQWYANGRAVAGARSARYTIPASVAGETLSVKVTGTKAGYTTASATSAAKKVALGALAHSVKQAGLSGAAKVGSTLTATRGTWSPTPSSFTYRWYANGRAITGASRSSYTIAASLAGKKISVRITAAKAGYTTVTIASLAKTAAKGTLSHHAAKAKITGKAKVGATLKAARGTWSPSGITFRYQWYASGKAIAHARKSSYTIASAYAGESITVKITASKSGYRNATIRSSAVKVAKSSKRR